METYKAKTRDKSRAGDWILYFKIRFFANFLLKIGQKKKGSL